MSKRTAVRVAILVHEDASISLALLIRDILRRTNLLLDLDGNVTETSGASARSNTAAARARSSDP
jgi:hypothetical protein